MKKIIMIVMFVFVFSTIASAANLIIRPNAAGNYEQWTATGTCTNNWECVDEAVADESTSYVRETAQNQRDSYNTTDHTSESGTISNVDIVYRVAQDGDDGLQLGIILAHAPTVVYSHIEITPTDSFVYYNVSWSVRPNDSATWTWEDIDLVQATFYSQKNGPAFTGMNVTQVFVNVTYTPTIQKLNVTLLIPTQSIINVTQDNTFNVSANITCAGGCGNVNGTIFYNDTSNSYPDTELPGATTSTPFYNFTNLVNISCGTMGDGDQCLVSWLVNATGEIGSDWLLNVTARSDDGGVEENSTETNFQVNIVKPRLNMTLIYPDANMNIVDWYNFTINGTITCIGGGRCGNVEIAARYNDTSDTDPDAQIPSVDAPITTADTNPYSCPSTLWSGQSCNYQWTINIIESGSWFVDVNASTDDDTNVSDITNDSLNRIVTAPAGLLNISNFTVSPTNIETGNTFWVNATVNCVDGLCFNISASARYNDTSPETPDTPIPTSGSPMNTDPNPRYCDFGGNNTVNGSGCIVMFEITTVDTGNYSIDINFTSTDTPVPENDSDNVTIRVYSAAVVLAFTVTMPGGAVNGSDPTFPGNSTQHIWFNATGSFTKYLEPCRADHSDGIPDDCQTTWTTPILKFTNIGNVPFNITMRLNETLPASLKLFANFSYPNDEHGPDGGCGGSSLADNDTVITTTQLNFTKALCVNNETDVWLWANFSYVMAGEIFNTLNYTSHTT